MGHKREREEEYRDRRWREGREEGERKGDERRLAEWRMGNRPESLQSGQMEHR